MFFDHHIPFNAPIIFRAYVTLGPMNIKQIIDLVCFLEMNIYIL